MTARNEAGAVDGVLLVDKPGGPTSHDVVVLVRRAMGAGRAGHAGTLDPFATGLLIVCLGRATRLARFLGGGSKSYEGVIRLGLATDTDDVTGRPLRPPCASIPSPDELMRAAGSLRGAQLQTPPVFSAKKIGGVAAHRRARRGRPVLLRPVPVTVQSFEITGVIGQRVSFTAVVSPGTYVRALARDLGETLGIGACLENLRRTGSGWFRVDEAAAPTAPPEELSRRLLAIEDVPLGLPDVRLSSGEAVRLSRGQAVACPSAGTVTLPASGLVRLLGPQGRLVGIGRTSRGEAGSLRLDPEVVLTPHERDG
jgi:tRNA pseudouridine55 synthase